MSYRVYRNNRSYRGNRQEYVDVNRNTDRQYNYYQQHQQYDDRNRYNDNDYDYQRDNDQHYYYNNYQMDNQRQRYPDSNQQNQYRQNQYRQNYQPQYQQRYQQPYQPRYELKYEREQKYQQKYPQKYQQKVEQKHEQKLEQKHEQKLEQKTKPKTEKSAPKSWIEYDEEDEEEEINYNEISDDQQHEIKSCDSRSNLGDFGDIDEYQHYNQPIDHQTIETQSNYSRSTYTTQRNLDRQRTQNIRDMNNWCKYVNITHSIREVYGKQNNTKIKILDIGCGAGNDFMKCRGNKKYIKKFLGIDIDYDYIINARRKYFKSLQDGIKHKNATYQERKKFSLNNAYGQSVRDFYDEPMFDAQFICNDMTKKDLYKHPEIIAHKPFELVNIQFALHFAFQTMNSVQALMKILQTATKSGTYFICSFMRDELIIKRLGQLMGDSIVDDGVEFIEFKNEFQRIKMKKIDFLKIQEIYDEHKIFDEDIEEIYNEKLTAKDEEFCHGLVGIPYKYFQMDSVEGDDGDGDYEFFIGFNILCKLLWKYCKMRLVFKKTASDIYIESSRKFPYRYGYSKGRELNNVKWTNDEQQVIDTYAYALFQRV